MSDKDQSLFIECQCHGEGLGIDYYADDNHYYFSYWSRGFRNGKLSFWQRLRYIFYVLFTGKPFNDELILDGGSANQLRSFLKDIDTKNLEEKYGESRKN
jgi:hypothetical protein